ncbi:MAG: histidine--tRNA ligase [bacterium]|nr:histidine--tRNA ligase [bacterium]
MPSVKIQPRLPKGFRDFLPAQMIKREYVFNTVREVFHLYGFEPLQTPVLELNETLMGKYGEEAENLIFSAKHGRSDKDELSMRYDLTVPLARVFAQYESHLPLPFKRYQISPVFRGERPQRGRYREFYQCDADIVGIASMSADAEILGVVVTALTRLGFQNFSVKVNNRKLLTGIGIYSGVPDSQLPDLYRSVDKFDKIGAEGVQKELVERGVDSDVVARMMSLITSKQQGAENLDLLEDVMGTIPVAAEGIRELRELAGYLEDAGVNPQFYEFDFTMVRGLGYYTGPIFETVITEPNLGSITGGGRYDDLIGLFRRESLPTTGTSLGIERIIDLMDELQLYPAGIGGTVVQVLVTVFDENSRSESAKLAAELRAAGINTELYMQNKKLGDQMKYADRKGIPMVVVMGPDEAAQGVVKLKRLKDGEEATVERTAFAVTLSQFLD